VLTIPLASAQQSHNQVIAKEKQELCLAILEADGDMETILSVFSSHIGGFDVVPAVVGDGAGATSNAGHGGDDSEQATVNWKHVNDRWIPAICKMMQQHVDLPVVQREGCRVLTLLCQQPENGGQASASTISLSSLQNINVERQNIICELNGLQAIVAGMHVHKLNPELQSAACRTIRILCHKNATNRDVAGQCKAIGAMIQALKDHVKVASVVTEGCTTLAAMCFENTKNKDTLREDGGIPAMVECMTTCSEHVTDAAVHSSACVALWKSCFENGMNRDAIREAGGIPAILFAMKTFLSPPTSDNEYGTVEDETRAYIEVQVQAMGALMNLSHQNSDNKTTARSAGAFDAVLSAMKAYPNEALVQKHGCGALNNLLGDGRSVGRGENVHKIKQQLVDLNPDVILTDAAHAFPKECGALVRALLKKLS
jgi:hypothetical protein